MRRKNQEITDNKIIEEILSKSEICRLGFIDNGLPYIIPFNYGYSDKSIYIHSAPDGKKIDLLKQNPRVCFEIELISQITKHNEPCHWSTKYKSVIGYGSVEIIRDYEQKIKGLDIIMSHYDTKEPKKYNKNQVNKIVILKLNIEKITGKQSNNWID
jgi:hypothetical protein